jgi:uncharacterized protein
MSHRVVLDTNCVISALIFSQEKMAWLRQGWQSGRFTPLVNKQTVSELLRVLAYPKFKLTKAEQGLLPQNDPAGLPTVRDCADQMFLSLAVVGKAEVLVTGDNDLLVLKDTLTVPIMTLNEFEIWLRSK